MSSLSREEWSKREELQDCGAHVGEALGELYEAVLACHHNDPERAADLRHFYSIDTPGRDGVLQLIGVLVANVDGACAEFERVVSKHFTDVGLASPITIERKELSWT